MRNLVSNAIKFTPEEGMVAIGVHVISATTGEVVNPERRRASLGDVLVANKLLLRVTVTDTGAGISKVAS
jgi:signal transduction histidine kinase